MFASLRLLTFVALSVVIASCEDVKLSPDLQKRIEHQVRAYSEAPPDAVITLLPQKPSEFINYVVQPVAIKVGETAKNFDFLLAKDGSRLLYVTALDLRSDPYRQAMDKIHLINRPVRGPANAPVTVVMYDDFQCPFCAKLYQQLVPVVVNDSEARVRLILKDLPISDAHMWARRAALDANCLAQQNSDAYWAFADYVHTHQAEFNQNFKDDLGLSLDKLALVQAQHHNGNRETLQACMSDQKMSDVDASLSEGKALGVTATPTIFVNGEEYEGVLSAAQIRVAIDRALHEVANERATK